MPSFLADASIRSRKSGYTISLKIVAIPAPYLAKLTRSLLLTTSQMYDSVKAIQCQLHPAHIFGGVLNTWGGKDKALVDHRGYAKLTAIAGHVFVAESEEVALALRVYGMDEYEVVRCTIHMKDSGHIVRGLTFNFVGDEVLELCMCDMCTTKQRKRDF
jgi:hypothetical protein